MPNKIFVLDTNVLLHDANAIHMFGKENDIVIPISVLEELDNFKKRQDEVGRNSRQVTRDLDMLRKRGHLAEGVELPRGGILRIELRFQEGDLIPPGFHGGKPDTRILELAYGLTKEEKEKSSGKKVSLVTKDINLRVKADAIDVFSEDYENRTVDLDDLYTGSRVINVSRETVDAFYRERIFKGPVEPALRANEFVTLADETNPDHTALGRYDFFEEAVVPLELTDDRSIFGVRPLNREQRFSMELLLNDKIPLVALVGIAGTGKTLLALAAGLEKVVNEDVFRRLLASKPIMPLGKDIGYLPGDVEEKLMPRMQSVSDNLEYLFMATGGNDFGGSRLQELIEDGIIELEPLTYIRGRSIPQQYVIVDEAQNLTPQEIKTIITRVGKGTKIVLCGDPYQIDHPYIDARSNGLTYVVDRFKGEPLFGTMTLTKGERSDLAELAARVM